MNRFYDLFDTHKWNDLAGADYLSDNDDFSLIFLGPAAVSIFHSHKFITGRIGLRVGRTGLGTGFIA